MTAWLGVDPGSHRAAACILTEHRVTVRAFEMDSGDLAARLAQLNGELLDWLWEQPQASCIVVEKPTVRGKSNALTLAAFGVCVATAHAVMPCPLFDLPSNTWRARTPLGGNASKEAVMQWASGYGVEGEDESMAFGCAWAARVLFEDDRRARAAA